MRLDVVKIPWTEARTSINICIDFWFVSIRIRYTELKVISLSLSLPFFFSIKRCIEGTCRHSKELSYWCIPESVEAELWDHELESKK